ncbi:MAG: DUF488 family protein [Candidatus Nitrosocosmicus sp.]|nr:DUF488 family protein [Candidatus Nitrosocosmicus sp.]MDN5867172.1 DUF488 family protein [Candidatus Nitrosocosmicus sp.]
MIKAKRIYDYPRGTEGKGEDGSFRILVDRLWPRGLSKDKVKIDLWEKDVAPSTPLRKWFAHDEDKWNEFKHRYFKELENNGDSVQTILDKIKEHKGAVTLLYGAKDEKLNNATALKEYLEKKIKE